MSNAVFFRGGPLLSLAAKDITFVCVSVFQAKTALTPLKKKVESECLHTHMHRWLKCPFSWHALSCRAVIFAAPEGDQCWGKKEKAFPGQLTTVLLLLFFFYLKSILNDYIYRMVYND